MRSRTLCKATAVVTLGLVMGTSAAAEDPSTAAAPDAGLVGFGNRSLSEPPSESQALAQASSTSPLRQRSEPDSGIARGRTRTQETAGWGALWPLVVVIGLIGIVAWLFKRMLPPSRALGRSGIEVLGRTYLSSKQSLAVVRIGSRCMIVGITPEHINTLATIEDPGDMAALMTSTRARDPFRDLMRKEEGAYGEPVSAGNQAKAARTDLRGLLKRVRELKSAS